MSQVARSLFADPLNTKHIFNASRTHHLCVACFKDDQDIFPSHGEWLTGTRTTRNTFIHPSESSLREHCTVDFCCWLGAYLIVSLRDDVCLLCVWCVFSMLPWFSALPFIFVSLAGASIEPSGPGAHGWTRAFAHTHTLTKGTEHGVRLGARRME